MTLQNRALPDGSIVAKPWRGSFMGNRGGRIHDPATRTLLKKRWASRRWIICVTEFKGRQRSVMGDGYTELFFADEASALAGGHRPCFECRRAEANAFTQAWQRAFGAFTGSRADAMDKVLHTERTGEKPAVARTELDQLPDGVMVQSEGRFLVKKDGEFLEWQPEGYRAIPLPPSEVRLLTPPSIIEVLRHGYQPHWPEARTEP